MTQQTPSLKNRLIAAATAWIALGMVLAWFALASVFQVHVSRQFQDELFLHLEELQRLAVIDDDRAALRSTLSDPRYDVQNSGFYWEIQRADAVLARSQSLRGAPLKTPPDGRGDVGVHTHTIAGPTGTLIVAEKLEWKDPAKPPLQFIIGSDKRHLDSVLGRFETTLTWSLVGLGLSMVLAAATLIAYAMRPFSQLQRALDGVRASEAKRLDGPFPSEVQPLVDTMNALLSSTTELVQRARTQAGNIAHGLKTPLAILTDEAHRIADSGLAKSSETILDQCRRMQAQIDYQTTRARVVANRLTPGASARLREATADVVSALSRLYGHKGVRFDIDIPDDIAVACDRQDLQEIVANIADNAGKHAASRVMISAAVGDARMAVIRISDNGKGLPPEAYEVVFRIGEQWDTQAAQTANGSGLGLAIARDLAVLYGGTIDLSASALGGLEVVIRLPLTR